MITGPELFFRYAQPPNLLGYCGPDRRSDISVAASGTPLPAEEAAEIAAAFHGAWPYLELIGGLTGRDPLSAEVVEAYWIGNHLLDSIDLQHWGHSVSGRFKQQAGARWEYLSEGVNRGGSPTHAFHVFCVYPWVGLLRQGFVEPAVEVLNRCRIGIGRVTGVEGDLVVVSRRPLLWADDALCEGEPVVEPFRTVVKVKSGDVVALHWDYICQRLRPEQRRSLSASHDRHLRIANDELRRARLEPAH